MQITTNIEEQGQCTAEIIAWLHQVFEMIEQKRPVQPDPFYERTSLLTKEVVTNVITSLEGVFKYELEKFPGYHNRAQGISSTEHLITPGFDKLSYQEQLAVVQGIDKICCRYKATKFPEAVL